MEVGTIYDHPRFIMQQLNVKVCSADSVKIKIKMSISYSFSCLELNNDRPKRLV